MNLAFGSGDPGFHPGLISCEPSGLSDLPDVDRFQAIMAREECGEGSARLQPAHIRATAGGADSVAWKGEVLTELSALSVSLKYFLRLRVGS